MKVILFSYRDAWYAEIRSDDDISLELAQDKSPKGAFDKLKQDVEAGLNRYKVKLAAVEAFEKKELEVLNGGGKS